MTSVDAIYEDGMLKPDQALDLPNRQRVHLIVQPVGVPHNGDRREARRRLIERLRRSSLSFGGPMPNREELHERHGQL